MRIISVSICHRPLLFSPFIIGSKRGRVVTIYGPSGSRGESGAAVLGGKPNDPGIAITHEMIINGTIQIPGGGTQPPAIPVSP